MPLPYCYEHPRPAVSVDLVACAFDGREIRVLVVKRGNEPHVGKWALPGGFMAIAERLHEAALRELAEETGLDSIHELHMLGIFDTVKRDPRGRVLSVAFGALVRWPISAIAGDDAREASWTKVNELESLAFDHQEILERGMRWLSLAVLAGTGGMALLPESFSTQDAKRLFKAIGLPVVGVSPWLERLKSEGLVSATRNSNKLGPGSTHRVPKAKQSRKKT